MSSRWISRAMSGVLTLFWMVIVLRCSWGDASSQASDDAGLRGTGGEAGSGGAAGSEANTGSSGMAGATVPDDAGTRCESAEPLVISSNLSPVILSLQGDTTGAGSDVQGGLQVCAGLGAGPDRFYALDLSQLSEPAWVTMLLSAEDDMLLRLERGSCQDPFPLLCFRVARGDVMGGRPLSAQLDPGHYLLSVDGATVDDSGSYNLQVIVEPAETSCEVPPNTTCGTAQRIPTGLSLQSLFVGASCGDSQQESPALYYELDLRQYSQPAAVRVGLQRIERFSDYELSAYPAAELFALDGEDACGTLQPTAWFWFPEDHVNARLDPGRYLLRYDERPSVSSLLTVNVMPLDCVNASGDSCTDPQNLDLAGGFVEVTDHTYCNTDQLYHEDCSEEDAADRFYRIDLSNRESRARLRARLTPQGLDFYAQLLLFQEEQGDCGPVLHCFDSIGNAEGWPSFDVVVDPGSYLLAVDGVTDGAVGHFTLQVEVSDAEDKHYRPCFDLPIDHCLFFYNEAAYGSCCDNPLLPHCGVLFMSCGLEPAVHDCVCALDPVCCNGGEDDFEQCAEAFAACSFFCPSDEPTLMSCLDQEALRGG